jgi:mevalonate kinase
LIPTEDLRDEFLYYSGQRIDNLNFGFQKVVAIINKQNEQAKDIMEQQDEMITDYKAKMEAAVEKINKKLLEKAE